MTGFSSVFLSVFLFSALHTISDASLHAGIANNPSLALGGTRGVVCVSQFLIVNPSSSTVQQKYRVCLFLHQ